MLKGVNKQVLEVSNPDSPYFEKIIFYVRAGSPHIDEKKLKKEAEKISTSTAVKPPRVRVNKKQLLLLGAYSFVTMLSSLAIYYLVYNFLVG